MVLAVTAFLWLSIAALSSAESAAAGNGFTNDQSVVSLVVQQAVQLHQQSGQLQRLQKRLGSLEASLENKTAQHTALTTTLAKQAKRQSFRAVLRKEDVRSNTPVHFHQQFATGRRMYDQNTGIYTADAPGVYLFTFQLWPQFREDSLVDLYINNAVMIRSSCYSYLKLVATPCASSSFFHLQKGNKVWVQTNKAGKYYLDVFSFFSGALIFPDA